eukprot:COSAG06_NODE_13653_length_1235_cov_1.007042_1_plen_162_part_00
MQQAGLISGRSTPAVEPAASPSSPAPRTRLQAPRQDHPVYIMAPSTQRPGQPRAATRRLGRLSAHLLLSSPAAGDPADPLGPPLKRDFIGYGGAPPDPKWPGGAAVALNFVINVEEGSEPSIPDGDGATTSGLIEPSAVRGNNTNTTLSCLFCCASVSFPF